MKYEIYICLVMIDTVTSHYSAHLACEFEFILLFVCFCAY